MKFLILLLILCVVFVLPQVYADDIPPVATIEISLDPEIPLIDEKTIITCTPTNIVGTYTHTKTTVILNMKGINYITSIIDPVITYTVNQFGEYEIKCSGKVETEHGVITSISNSVFFNTIPIDNDNDGYTEDVDCDDNDSTIFPGALEILDDGIDQDCDYFDEKSTYDLSIQITPEIPIIGVTITFDCVGEDSSYESVRNNLSIKSKIKIENAVTGYLYPLWTTPTPFWYVSTDELLVSCLVIDFNDKIFYATDEKSYGTVILPKDNDKDGYTEDVDCNDNNNTVYPDAPELFDFIDNDCDGIIDEGLDHHSYHIELDSVPIFGEQVFVTCVGDGSLDGYDFYLKLDNTVNDETIVSDEPLPFYLDIDFVDKVHARCIITPVNTPAEILYITDDIPIIPILLNIDEQVDEPIDEQPIDEQVDEPIDEIKVPETNYVLPKSGGSCSDCTPPTLGYDSKGVKQVDNGICINNSCMDGGYFHTDYPLQNTMLFFPNQISTTYYENQGPTNLYMTQLGIGVDEIGSPINESQAIIEVYLDYFSNDVDNPSIKEIILVDPDEILGNVTVDVNLVNCMADSDGMCLQTVYNYQYVKLIDSDILMSNAADYKRNAQNNYFNDGLHLIYNVEPEIIEESTFERFTDTGEPRTRMHSEFANVILQQQVIAQNTMDKLYKSSESITRDDLLELIKDDQSELIDYGLIQTIRNAQTECTKLQEDYDARIQLYIEYPYVAKDVKYSEFKDFLLDGYPLIQLQEKIDTCNMLIK